MNKKHMDELESTFYYVYSSSLDTNIQVKILSLERVQCKLEFQKMLDNEMLKHSGLYQNKENQVAELLVMTQIYSNGRPISLPISTSYKPFTNRWCWSEWIKLPVMFSDLPRDAVLTLTVYDCIGRSAMRPVGGTAIPLFGKHGRFRQGCMDLLVWPDTIADGSPNSKTPGKPKYNDENRMHKLSKLSKTRKNNQMVAIDWLDRLTFREIELISEKEKGLSKFFYLTVEFPQITLDGKIHSVVFFEEDDDQVYQFRSQKSEIVTLFDTEVLQENLVEEKHHKLSRSLRTGISDKDVKPNASVRDMLNTIVGYPPTKQLTTEEQDLVWKFRFYLSNQNKALTKFLRCVKWDLVGEMKQAIDMMERWAPMDVEDALQLLSPYFTHPTVRRYAISRLQQAPDEDLVLYLLQLVQALKYENYADIIEAHDKMLITISSFDSNLDKSSDSFSTEISRDNEQDDLLLSESSKSMDLASFLIYRACNNFTLANYLYWYLTTECESKGSNIKQDTSTQDMYIKVKNRFERTLQSGCEDWQNKLILLQRQKIFIDQLVHFMQIISRESGTRNKKMEKFQSILADAESFRINFSDFEALPLPLDPRIVIKGIIPEKAFLFKSAQNPCRLTFQTVDGKEYLAIFKHGDDLRQDQLILQIITLIDKLLRCENLDLKLTPYSVLATSYKHGFVQYVESYTVAEVLKTEGTIQNFFRKHHPNTTGPYGIASDVMDTYVRSCAGYCVITYLLGVGDRHLDNLLLTTNGKLFHIDFGFILGRDPKPFPPPMKLSREMVEAMGGVSSEHYKTFVEQCNLAFLHLRRHGNLILNLFSLMVDASVPDIALEPDKAVKKVQDKLRLDLNEEEACAYMKKLLDMSVSAVMAVLVDQFHKFAQYWRR